MLNPIYSAIITTYRGPTNTLPARIHANAIQAHITQSYDWGLSAPDNHRAACEALAKKLGWDGKWFAGELPSPIQSYVFVRTFPQDA